VATHLAAHPSTLATATAVRVPGCDVPDEYPTPAVPRGWKIGRLVPHYSPALSGGGLSEAMLADMMREMQGMPGGGPAAMVGQAMQGMMGERPKKIKRKIVRG
jgi:signal recognition particle subunit SRP19